MTDYAHPEVLITPQWLMEHLNDPAIRIVEVDMSSEPYANAHIPGAVFWNVFTDLLQPDLSMKFEGDAISPLLARSGITPDTTVIAYGSYPGTGAWIFWFLKELGHQKVLVLNGGYQKWIAEGGPVAAELSTVPAAEYAALGPARNTRISQPEVQAAIEQEDQVLLDVRSPEEYRGEMYLMEPPKGEERGGHIPGAVHIEHTQTLNADGTFKSVDELRALYEHQGITADKGIIPYCAIGARSAYTCFVLQYLLGYPNVRNYDGSWNQWSRLPNVPIAQEPSTMSGVA